MLFLLKIITGNALNLCLLQGTLNHYKNRQRISHQHDKFYQKQKF